MRPRPNLSATLGTNSPCDPLREPHVQVWPLGASTQSRHMGLAMPLCSPSSPEWEVPRRPYPALCSGIPLLERHLSQTTGLHPSHKMTPNSWELGQNPRGGDSSIAHGGSPTFHGSPGHSIQSQKPERTLPTRPSFITRGAPLTVCSSGLPDPRRKPKPRLCFQNSVPTWPGPHSLQAGASGAAAQDCACPLHGNCAQSIRHDPYGLGETSMHPCPRGHPNSVGRPGLRGAL